VKDLRRWLLLLAIVVLAIACRDQHEWVSLIPKGSANIVVVFKKGTSIREMNRFLGDAIDIEDGKGGSWPRPGVGALVKIGVGNHDAYAVAFRPNSTPQQRDDIKRRARRSPVVYRILENVGPGEIKLE
jgi:hypothetical protein